MDNNTICPVCTLYLREGITLQDHLNTHPKEQVIDALLKLSDGGLMTSSCQATASRNSYVPVQAITNSHSSIVSSPYVNPPTQMTTAVTYQQFMTSNGSAIMPQFIQVPTIVNPNNNVPVISSQSMNFIPNQMVNYSQTVYNPLYNPYIPQPYPFSQPVYTSMPVPTLSPNESVVQSTGIENESSSNNNQEDMQKEISVDKCSVATSTESGKRISKIGTKTTLLKSKKTYRKKRVFKSKISEQSTSLSVIKSPIKIGSVNLNRLSSFPKRSVIRTLRPKFTSATSKSELYSSTASTNLTTTAESRVSITPSEASPTLNESQASFGESEGKDSMDIKEVVNCTRPNSTPAILSLISDSEEKYFEHPKLNSVIVESSAVVQNDENDITDIHKIIVSDTKTHVNNSVMNSDFSDASYKNSQGLSTNDICEDEIELPDVSLECNFEEEIDESEDNLKIEESVLETIVIEERKIDYSKHELPDNISKVNGKSNSSTIDSLTPLSNFPLTDNSEKGNVNSILTSPKNKRILSEQSGNEDEFRPYKREISQEPPYQDSEFDSITQTKELIINECASEEGTMKPVELQSVTYTNLQPAKSSKIFHEFGLSPTINVNSYMEVDGIKIFFNNNTTNRGPFDSLVKFSNIQTNSTNLSGFLKIENSCNNQAIMDSVIHLVSGNDESKNEFSFDGGYTATTSNTNENQFEFQNLSPLTLNIQADESMPARGELSEQESLGAENSTWNLFHSNNSTSRNLEEWKNCSNSQGISVIGNKKSCKTFKCSLCGDTFSCPKERRVHKNTVHLAKNEKETYSKKSKTYSCSFCNKIFTALRDRKLHVMQNHIPQLKMKKTSGNIKEETVELETTTIEKVDAVIKNESEQGNNIKTEQLLASVEVESESQRVKYCSQCSLPFVGIKKLREHLRLVHGEVRFKCETCSQFFDDEPDFNDHLLVHPLACDKCGKTFHKRPNLNLHMKRHLEVKPYECTLCPKSFITRQKLEEHMNGHSGKKPLKCSLCDKTFSRHSNLIQHRNLHHLNVRKKIKDFVCRCGEVFHSLRKLEWHKEVHEPKPKPCPFCSQKFVHSASVTRHIRRAHLPDYLPGDNREYDNVQCPICEKVYLRSSLAVHMRVHNGEKPFSCKICNKRFSTKWNLELHNWTHQSRSNMPFKCHICKGAFFREPDFIAHLNAHRNYKPFTCNICGQKFIRKYSCLRHQEEHKKNKRFVCAVSGCAKSFHRGYYLRDHMKVHTGLRPHTCHICGKASSTKSNHNKHVRIHDTREPINTEN